MSYQRAINLERNDLIQRARADLDNLLKESIDKKAMSNAIYDRAQKRVNPTYLNLKKVYQQTPCIDLRSRTMLMSKWDPDTHDAILWLRANNHLFRMEVIEPLFMSLSVKDRRYANAIEACFAGNQIKVWHWLLIFLWICSSLSFDHLVPCLSGQSDSSADESWRGLTTVMSFSCYQPWPFLSSRWQIFTSTDMLLTMLTTLLVWSGSWSEKSTCTEQYITYRFETDFCSLTDITPL